MSERATVEIPDRDLESLDSLWSGGLGEAYNAFLRETEDARVALAAAMVEIGIKLQGIGSHVAAHGELLLGDLCLARASRLLADVGDQHLQIAFARVVERVSSDAAAGVPAPGVRPLLMAALAR
ncbi:MAG TPA: hypothetical protein VF134_04640 [Candidatus Dormibacteraeota bacterium]